MGYAGGTEDNPAYHNLGGHSETIQIDYDPDVISYSRLLDVFWEANAGAVLPNSRQYLSIMFYHNEEQRKLALESYESQKAKNSNTIDTEIIPFAEFYPAEDYHQKYYLQQEQRLMKDLTLITTSFDNFVASTIAARLNGYVGGYGSQDILLRNIDNYGLSVQGKIRILEIADRGLVPGCPSP